MECERTSSEAQPVVIEHVETREVEKPIDLYIMFDRTLSTECATTTTVVPWPTRWQAFTGALRQFVQSPAAAGISVGIQYYGLNGSCDPNVYARPDVPIAELPGNAAAIVASLNRGRPSGNTPLNAALRGALQHARSWAMSHPDRTVAVVLTTDASGTFPCGNALVDSNAAAAEGFGGSPSIRTYVIGQVPGPNEPVCFYDITGTPNPAHMHAIAQNGGTSEAILVETGEAAAQQFLAALNQIRESVTVTEIREEISYEPVDCEWKIPDPPENQSFDPEKVNFEFSDGGGAPTTIGGVDAAGDCAQGSGGWYYDDPENPTKILVCPDTCTTIQAARAAKVDIIFGCERVRIH